MPHFTQEEIKFLQRLQSMKHAKVIIPHKIKNSLLEKCCIFPMLNNNAVEINKYGERVLDFYNRIQKLKLLKEIC